MNPPKTKFLRLFTSGLLSLFLLGCQFFEETKVEPNTPDGQALFWTRSETLGGAYIDITFNSRNAGRISVYSAQVPTCGSSNGFVYVSVQPGTYNWSGQGQDGSTWKGTITISSGRCQTMELN